MKDPAALPLRDIHLPEPVSWWPPAPGWWILLGLSIFIILASWYWRRLIIKRKLSAIYLARKEFNEIEEQLNSGVNAKQIVNQLSILLRRLSISLYPRMEVAGLTGEAWLSFLDRPLASSEFANGPGRVLIDAPYRPEINDAEIKPLIESCRRWLKAVEKDKGRQRQ